MKTQLTHLWECFDRWLCITLPGPFRFCGQNFGSGKMNPIYHSPPMLNTTTTSLQKNKMLIGKMYSGVDTSLTNETLTPLVRQTTYSTYQPPVVRFIGRTCFIRGEIVTTHNLRHHSTPEPHSSGAVFFYFSMTYL